MSTKPLQGLKVVDFTMAASGPICTKLLAEWGADVVKIEAFGGEMIRYRPKELADWTNLNKRDIVVNAKSAEGRDLIYRLIKEGDFFITNFRTQALERLQLDYESVRALNPKIIYGSITGYGDQGPEGKSPGYDITAYWARTGLLLEMTEKDTAPIISPLGIGDYGMGTTMVGGILAAYIEMLKTGEGQHVYSSLYGYGLFINQWYIMRPQIDPAFTYPTHRIDAKEPMSNCFKAKDGTWFQITLFDFDRYFPILMDICGRTDLLGTPGYDSFQAITDNNVVVNKLFDEGFAKYDYEELDKLFAANNIAHAKICLPQECLTDEQAWANHYLINHTMRDGTEVIMPASPIKFGVDDDPDHRWSPLLGENTAEVMKELGYTEDEIQDYIDRKIVDVPHEQ